MWTTTFAATLLATLLFAGCLGDELNESPSQTTARRHAAPTIHQTPAMQGTMTATEKRQDAVAPCLPNQVNPPNPPAAFCATRSVWVQGTLDLSSLPVYLSTFVGPVTVQAGAAGAWNLTAILTARGASPEMARDGLSHIEYNWSHESDGGHFVKASAQKKDKNEQGLSAELHLWVPADLVASVVATSGTGSVSLDGLDTSQLSLSSGTGSVHADAKVQVVQLSSGTGSLDARLEPTAGGSLSLSTGTGSVSLALVEDARHGYDLDASAGTGSIDIQLKDGTTSGASRNDKHFTSTNYGSRPIQQVVDINTGTGSVTVKPA